MGESRMEKNKRGSRHLFIMLLSVLMIGGFQYAVATAGVIGVRSSTGVKNFDGNYLQGDGFTSLGSDCIVQCIYAGIDGVITPPNLFDGSPTGDDQLLETEEVSGRFYTVIGEGYPFSPNAGKFSEDFRHSLNNGSKIYCRAWNNFDFVTATCYGDSPLYTIENTIAETHDFGTWTTNNFKPSSTTTAIQETTTTVQPTTTTTSEVPTATTSLSIPTTVQSTTSTTIDTAAEIIIGPFKHRCNQPYSQMCSPTFNVTVEATSELKIQYFVHPDQCSSIRLHIFLDEVFVMMTDFLGYQGNPTLPLQTDLINLGPVSVGTHIIQLQAEGKTGGCNKGVIWGWGGTLIVLTSPTTSYDLDNDGVSDIEDNCLNVFNPDQADSDSDGIGDECDVDYLKAALQSCRSQLAACCPQTAITLSSLQANSFDKKVILKWQTETETNNAGFNIWRAEGFKKINESIIPALGSPTVGSEYDFVDEWVLNGNRYFYLLEDIDNNGLSTFHGPVKAVPRWWYGMEN
jgi:hypothetical protein